MLALLLIGDNPKDSYFNTFFLAFTYIYFILNITEKLHCAVILLYNFSLKLHKMYISNFVKVLEIQDYLCIKEQKRGINTPRSYLCDTIKDTAESKQPQKRTKLKASNF